MGVPIGGGVAEGLRDVWPIAKVLAFECQRSQDTPPSLNEIEVTAAGWDKEEFPARMGQHEEQDLESIVAAEIVEYGDDLHGLGWHPRFDLLEEVEPSLGVALVVKSGERVSGCWHKGAVDEPAVPPEPVFLVNGSALGPQVVARPRPDAWVTHEALSRANTAQNRPQFIQADDYTALFGLGVCPLNRPLFSMKSGATTSLLPYQDS